MADQSKVKKFMKCIEATDSAKAARLMADKKYKLNASCFDDEAAWWEAVAKTGLPYSEAKE